LLNELMLLKPDNMWVYNFLGVIHLEVEKVQLALSYLEKAETIAPDYWLIHYHLAIGYSRNKEPGKAREEVRKAIMLNPPEEPKKMLLELQKSLI
jgi:Tfp pilus assembly protein PilF